MPRRVSSTRGCHSLTGTCLIQTAIFMFNRWRLERGMLFVLLEEQRRVCAAEAERVGERVVDLDGTALPRHVVEVAVGIWVVEVDGGGRNLMVHDQRVDTG